MFLFIHTTKIIVQSSRATGKGQSKGNNVSVGVVPPPPSPSIVVITPSVASGASIDAKNPAMDKQHAHCVAFQQSMCPMSDTRVCVSCD